MLEIIQGPFRRVLEMTLDPSLDIVLDVLVHA
jgi:hypothetical protein